VSNDNPYAESIFKTLKYRPNFQPNSSGKKAYIMNMYTATEYRRQGIAFRTLDLLVKAAKEQGVSQIALEATKMGRPLYERYGFVKMTDEMELREE